MKWLGKKINFLVLITDFLILKGKLQKLRRWRQTGYLILYPPVEGGLSENSYSINSAHHTDIQTSPARKTYMYTYTELVL